MLQNIDNNYNHLSSLSIMHNLHAIILYPKKITVYGRPDFKKLAGVVGQPMRDNNGNFELLEPFWNFETEELDEVHRLCSPLLVYADLVATGDARNIEVANMLRDNTCVA